MPQNPEIEDPAVAARFSYREMTAAVDRAYAVPKDQPLPVRQVFADLLATRGAQIKVEPDKFVPVP
jgi:hypothetical protein